MKKSDTKLHLGFSTLGCHDLDLAAVRALAVAHDSRFVEFRSLNGSLNLPDELDRFSGGAVAARKFLQDANVRTGLVASSFLLSRSPESDRATLAAFASAGEALGAPWLRIFGGGTWGDPLTPEMIATARAHRQWWRALRAARSWRIELILETHDTFIGSREVHALLDQTGGPMAILWDAHHTWKMAGESLDATWSQLGPLIWHVHLKDSLPQPSGRLPYTLVDPGRGNFPFSAALELLAANRFAGVVSLEWERQWHPNLASLDEILPLWNALTRPYRDSMAKKPQP